MSKIIKTETVVIGAGPGGYTAAFRLADLGKQVVLVERYKNLGGVCLNVGCIPSKALLHNALVINEAQSSHHLGITFDANKIDTSTIIAKKEAVVKKLSSGISALAKARKVKVINGYAKFINPNTLQVDNGLTIEFTQCIIAAGSRVAKPAIFPFESTRIMDSSAALDLETIPKKLLIVGGGIIGLEMACVYAALGSQIDIVELSHQLISTADADIVRPLYRRLKKVCHRIMLNTKVSKINTTRNSIDAEFIYEDKMTKTTYDKALIAIGRIANGHLIDAEKAGVFVNEHGFIAVDRQMRTNVGHIYAIGDIIGEPMLAHKAVYEAKVAAEVICGHKSAFDALCIPAVAYTEPEVAWVGQTEKQLKASAIDYQVGSFPWSASGRNLSIGRNEGITKALFDKKTKRLIGMGICGMGAGELIAQAALAIEMGSTIRDIALTIHPHPTLSETVAFAAEMAEGTITDLLPPK